MYVLWYIQDYKLRSKLTRIEACDFELILKEIQNDMTIFIFIYPIIIDYIVSNQK